MRSIELIKRSDIMSDLKNGIVLDPGHGGVDAGCVGNNLQEKKLTLEISLYQYKRFQQLGVPVKITRTTDKTLTPSQRTAIVNGAGMKHCMSNHINAGGGDGCEVIHSVTSNGRWAQLVAGELVKQGQNLRRVFSRAGSSGKDYYFMQRETKPETIITEYGFIDSKDDDVTQLKTKIIDYAESVVKAYCNYAGFKYTAPNGEKVNESIQHATDAVLPDGVFKKSEEYSADVKQIQIYLNYWLPSKDQLDADGYFGPATQEALAKFQTARNITSDGVYGPDSKRELLEFYADKLADEKAGQKEPAKEETVYRVQTGVFRSLESAKLLQNRLIKEGYPATLVIDKLKL